MLHNRIKAEHSGVVAGWNGSVYVVVVVLVNHCFTSLFVTKGLLSEIVIR